MCLPACLSACLLCSVGATPAQALMAAVLGGKSSSVRELLARGADPELPNRDGMTPLQAAAFQNQRDVIEALIEGGAVVEVRRCNNAYHISPDLVV